MPKRLGPSHGAQIGISRPLHLVSPPSPADTVRSGTRDRLDYIADLSLELARIASAVECTRLAALLLEAGAEAKQQLLVRSG